MQQPVAIVAGAGRGIGRATALELARMGYRLALGARNPEELKEVAKQAGDALAVQTDVTRSEQVNRLVEKTLEQFGRLDAVINCAGMAPQRSIAEMKDDEWRHVIDANLSSAFFLARAVWPIFEKQKGGVIVNVSSMAARDPFDGFAAYGAAKAGLNIFDLVAAREGQEINVRVHTIAPAAVETGMFRKLLSHDQWPSEKTLDPADVARLIVQCVTGELKYTSGEVLYVHKTL